MDTEADGVAGTPPVSGSGSGSGAGASNSSSSNSNSGTHWRQAFGSVVDEQARGDGGGGNGINFVLRRNHV